VPAGGILYETTPIPISVEQSDKLDEIPATDRLFGFIAAAPPAEAVKRKRRWACCADPMPRNGIVMSGRAPADQGLFFGVALVVGAVMSSAFDAEN
jgi:hypothetical protein